MLNGEDKSSEVEVSAEALSRLSAACIDAKARAYCPYSSFPVGASFLLASGEIVSGSNVENAAYPVGICAERCALGTAVAGDHRARRGDFRALAIATDTVGGEHGTASPCGMCRQALREFCDLDMPIFMHDAQGRYIVRTLAQLLPMSFGPEMLPPTISSK